MIRWVYAFVDRPREHFTVAAEFWTAVTGTSLSERRGTEGEFATLLPTGTKVGHQARTTDGAPEPDACLKLQGVASESGGTHLDLAVEDIPALVARAVSLGATVVAEQGFVVLASPAKQLFCAVTWHGEARRPSIFEGARLDQISIDIPPELYEEETTFWGELTGWPVLTGSRPEFRAVKPPAGLPVRILLHRLGTGNAMSAPASPHRLGPQATAAPPTPGVQRTQGGPHSTGEPAKAGAHLDFACADRATTRVAHEKLGASFVAEYPYWTVMSDPTGAHYCLTARDPDTGLLGNPHD
ncbi:VOC family protein [Kitasatospora acidiphila]|uniref:VOC family protein n=1 Tax=Kitasatospora acidiphila TaxID=2567942 RepID=A0A540VYF5_9ACTN|nr:VOC family protein [Kitasatospora acidiphila]TQF01785.1 VOC family protein [Kitasatospora acidiphila]